VKLRSFHETFKGKKKGRRGEEGAEEDKKKKGREATGGKGD